VIADSKLSVAGRWLGLLGLVLAVVGYFGAWVDHRASALAVTGFELAEFAKFLPQVQGGTVPITRELFYFPLVVTCVLLSLFAAWSAVRSARLVVPLVLVAVLLAVLLPYSVVDAARQVIASRVLFPIRMDPQYEGQLVLVLVGMVLTLLTPVARLLQHRWRVVLVALLVFIGIIPTLWQFTLFRPLVVALYDAPVGLGWGLVACVLGFALLLASVAYLGRRPAHLQR
jgi:hypothetical protein